MSKEVLASFAAGGELMFFVTRFKNMDSAAKIKMFSPTVICS